MSSVACSLDKIRVIYDCFIFWRELGFWELRLHELDLVVDYFLVLEASAPPTATMGRASRWQWW